MSTGDATSSRRRRHSSRGRGEQPPPESTLAAILAQLADALLVAALVAVPACFAGRTPIGQLVFISLAGALAVVWSLRQLTSNTPTWHSTPALQLWVAGVLVAGIQLTPLSTAWRDRLSPEIVKLLPLWTADASGLLPAAWTTLSLDPSETTSGLATFLGYALVFFVVLQRVKDQRDVAWLLKTVACIGCAMAVFALVQYFLSNGRFFWVYQHPVVSTDETVLGTFTNRNHFAQFLALAIGPALWWLSHAAKSPKPEQHVGFGGAPADTRKLTVALLSAGLGTMLLAGLMSLSRGGAAAIAVAAIVSLALLGRRGHIPARVIPMVLLVGAVVGGVGLATNYHILADRFDQMAPDERFTIWSANVRLALRFPWFGTGIGTHVYSHPLEVDRVDDNREFTHAESGYLQVASECGFVGLGLAVLMILVCLNWCRVALRKDAGPQSTAMTAAIAAAFAANLLHAFVDFIWFAPGCMIVVTVMAACVCRLAQWARAPAGTSEPARSSPRLVWAAGVCGTTALAAWMISVKLPGAFAEPHYQAFLHLQFHGSELEDDPAELERQRLTEISAAARANPRDCRTQHLAAGAFIRMFNLRQEASDTPLSLDQLRDAAVASEFSSIEALNEWLNAAVGPNRKLLKAAQHYARRAVLACPLEGRGYLYLARLDFLRDPQAPLVAPLHQQALAVRPFDAMVDFEIGRSALLDGDFETAMEYWRKAFHRSPAYRKDIAAALAGNFSAEELLDRLQPDCDGLSAMVAAFTEAKLDDELPQLREKYAEASIAQARQLSGWRSEQAWQEAARMYQEDGRPERAIRVLQDALEQHSQSLEFHKAIGKLLFEQERFAGAAKHLQWAALRAPDDEALQRLAADAIKQKLRHERTAERDEAVR